MSSYELKYDIGEKVQLKGIGNSPNMPGEVYAVTIIRHMGETVVLYKVQYLEWGEIKVASADERQLIPYAGAIITEFPMDITEKVRSIRKDF